MSGVRSAAHRGSAPPGRRARRRRHLLRLALLPAIAAVAIAAAELGDTGADSAGTGPGHQPATPTAAIPAPDLTKPPDPLTRPGSDPSALPGNVLIADKANNRLLEVDPYGHVVWRFPRPGD